MIGIEMETGAHAIDGDANERGVEAVLRRKSCKLGRRFRTDAHEEEKEDDLRWRKTCSGGPRPMRL